LTSLVVGELVGNSGALIARGTACPVATNVIPSSPYCVTAPSSGASSKSIVCPPRKPGTHSDGSVNASSPRSSPISWHAESSEVFPIGSVTVAVISSPDATGPIEVETNSTVPPPEVATVWPRWRSPSPLPDGSHAKFA
jgi:hypothetical protein